MGYPTLVSKHAHIPLRGSFKSQIVVVVGLGMLACAGCASSQPSLPDFPPFAAGQAYLDEQVRVQQDLVRAEATHSLIAEEGQQRIYLRGLGYLQAQKAVREAYRVQERFQEETRRQYEQKKQEQDLKRWKMLQAQIQGY